MTISNIYIAQFVSFIIFISFLLFPDQFILQSNTILGKLFSIFIIVLYTKIDFLYGLLVCVFIIFYYQSDLVSNLIYSENFKVVTAEPMSNYQDDSDSESDSEESDSYEHDIVAANKDERIKIDDAYAHHKLPIQSESETIFRNQHCSKNLELIYKKKIIRRNDLIPNIFPELEFIDDKPCNPCDPSCSFKKMEIKELIGQSTRGKTSLEEAMDWAYSFFVNKNEPFSGVDLNVASYL
jgi:hypothetical protein